MKLFAGMMLFEQSTSWMVMVMTISFSEWSGLLQGLIELKLLKQLFFCMADKILASKASRIALVRTFI